MKKKRIIIACGCVVAAAVLLLMGYQWMNSYMQNHFAPNTWVNGIYCTGKTVDEINEMLLSRESAPVVTVTDRDGGVYSYDLQDAGYTYDYQKSLSAYQTHQKNLGWISMIPQENLINTGNPEFSFETDDIETWWEQLPIVQAEKIEPVVTLTLTEEGYALESTLADHLDPAKGLTELLNAVSEGETAVSLADRDCYFDYEMSSRQKMIQKDYDELKELEQCGLVYDMGAEKIVFDEALMSRFIAKDAGGNPVRNEEGKFYYDLEFAQAYMDDLCEQYHTYGVDRPFLSSLGDVVMVPAGTYGTELDKRAEIAYFLEVLSDPELRLAETIHTPEYLHETPVKGLNDIGDTYIEVDMTNQMIYFYMDGKLMVSSGVVTGNLRSRHGTPQGAYFIYGKYKNRVLRGPGYASFVRRWMPVVKAIGLHDANWRDEFGGEIYKTNGSHGCVNMPDETTDIIFEYAEIGTPVMIFARPEETE